MSLEKRFPKQLDVDVYNYCGRRTARQFDLISSSSWMTEKLYGNFRHLVGLLHGHAYAAMARTGEFIFGLFHS